MRNETHGATLPRHTVRMGALVGAFSETCVICLTVYGNKLKLIEHLKQPNSICLRNSFNCCVPLSDHEVDDLSCELANIARLNRSVGWSSKHSDTVCAQAEGPPLQLTRHVDDPGTLKPVVKLAFKNALFNIAFSLLQPLWRTSR